MLINCPECNHVLSDKAKKCPHCGYKPKKKHGKWLAFIVVLFIVGGLGAFGGVKWYQSLVDLNQGMSKVELGDDVDLLDCVKYDKERIKDIKVVNDGNFESSSIGEYEVVYRATNIYNKSKDFTFNIKVRDTVAPKLVLKEKELYLAKGSDFDINDYATGDDKSDVKISYTGDFDINKAGDYNLSVVAVDDSNNISKEQSLIINVSDRSKADFRNAFFGDDAETIKRYETAEFDEVNSTKSVLLFTGESIGGVNCEVVYLLNKKGQLFSAHYSDEVDMNYVDGSKAIQDYETWCELLKKKYGKPDFSDENIISSLYFYADSKAQALELGYLQYWTEYKKKNVIISCYADTNDYRTGTCLRYKSTKYDESIDADVL